MKKTITFILVTIAVQSVAQPVINSGLFPGPGTTLTYIETNPAGLAPGPSGANQTWNFSAVTPSGSPSVLDYVNPATTPYTGNYPGSNVCEVQPDGAGGFIYSYFSNSATELLFRGVSFITGGNTVNFIYSNTQKLMQYPFNYNNTFTDNYAASYTIVQSGITITNYRTGTINCTYDGYGTLNLPGNSNYTNVARVKIRQVLTDSIVYVGLPVPPVLSYFSGTTHNWFATGIPGKSAMFTLSFDTTTSVSNPPAYNSYARYQTLSSGLFENQTELKQVHASPNPADNTTSLVIHGAQNGNALLKVCDMNGRTVEEVVLHFINPDHNHIQIDLSGYAGGIYSLQVTQDRKIWASKVVKL